MKVEKEKMDAFLSRLNNESIKRICPVCGGTQFSISDTIFELRELSNGNLVIGENQSLYPVVPLSCDSCGSTFFLNAIKSGLMEKKEGG